MYICDMSNLLDRDIQFLPGIGPKKAAILSKELGISTFRDMMYTFPFRYIDKSRIYAISELDPSMTYVQIRARMYARQVTGKGRGQRLVITVTDGTGKIDLVFFQGIKWISEKIKSGTDYIFFGKLSEFNGSFNIVHPEIEDVHADSTAAQVIGVYSSTEGLKKASIGNKMFAGYIHKIIQMADGYLPETLPRYLIEKMHLTSLYNALKWIHTPTNREELNAAAYRLKFEELLYLQLSLIRQKVHHGNVSVGRILPRVGEKFNHCYSAMPYELTGAQKRVIREIRSDMTTGKQMNRLLQGDVGSGKTAVALLCSLLAIDNGLQACIMAPTEVLATQHYKNAVKFVEGSGATVALLTGSTKTRERRELLEKLQSGEIDILIGTHALIEDPVVFRKLGIAIIDEQHRFGVEQRSRLWKKSDPAPHILVMTATPIPRTLAMTVYGDLDVSIIDELPPGRKPIKTMHATEKDRRNLNNFLKSQIKEGRQVFIVYPLIKESEKMDYKNLQEGYMNIIEEFPAPEYITAVVHGQQKDEDKANDMALFASGKANILVATSVIEVGVDVPNASVMVIESAERFGLSQLHQLRGRVGRGSSKAYCVLMTGNKLSKEGRQRIELMCQTQDGFILAEEDMKMRGPGDIEGTQQSGIAFDLKISSISKDTQLMELSRETASAIIEADNDLSRPENSLLRENLMRMKTSVADFSEIS